MSYVNRRIIVVVPPEMAEVLCRVETMLLVGLAKAGFQPTLSRVLAYDGQAFFIVLGANFLRQLETLPTDNVVVLNVENTESSFMTASYLQILRRFRVWDYSHLNAKSLRRILAKDVLNFRLFFVEELCRLALRDDREIDILFYGSFNTRRQVILDDLRSRGLNVRAVFGTFGDDLDRLLERSKVVINIHFYESGHLEWIRIFDLLANGCVVVSECNAEEYVDEDLLDAFIRAPYEGLADKAEELVRDAGLRLAVANDAKKRMRARDATTCLSEALRWSSMPQVPTNIVIGSGKSYDPSRLNVDIDAGFHPDVVCDIAAKDLFETEFQTSRFGSFRFERNAYVSLEAFHVLEHIPDLVRAMTNCLGLLEIGGVMKIAVPYDLSYGAWQDPTHVRAFNERSWQYYCDWFWYLGWDESRFVLDEIWYGFSEVGQSLSAAGTAASEILRIPRAVEEMRVTLRKIAATSSERSQGEALRGTDR